MPKEHKARKMLISDTYKRNLFKIKTGHENFFVIFMLTFKALSVYPLSVCLPDKIYYI